MSLSSNLLAQVQVTRNHVSGYRAETIIFGDRGQIQIGRFAQNPDEIVVEAYGRRGKTEPIARRVFPGGKAGAGAPEFVDRFGPAYKAEAAAFIDCCRHGAAFPGHASRRTAGAEGGRGWYAWRAHGRGRHRDLAGPRERAN